MPYYVDGDEHTRELRAAHADADSQAEVTVSLLRDLRAERATVAALKRTVDRLMGDMRTEPPTVGGPFLTVGEIEAYLESREVMP